MADKEWKHKYIPPLIKGFNNALPADLIPEGYSPDLKNVRVYNGRVVVDGGYTALGTTIRGTPRMLYKFAKTDGENELLLLTNDTLYIWREEEWQYIRHADVDTTLTGVHAAGTTTLTVADSSKFSVDDFVGIIVSNGKEHKSKIASIPDGTHITIEDGLSAQASDGAAVIKATQLSGGPSIQPSMTTWTPDDWVLISNGFDNVKRYDGTDCRDIPNLPSSGDCKARIVRVKDNMVLLFYTKEGGTEYPQRVRRSDVGDPTNWSTGTAGYDDLYDSSDRIVAAEELGPYMIIYRENSIVRMEYAGTADYVFYFTPTIMTEGAMSPHSVVNRGGYHLVFGSTMIYRYEGGFEIYPFGEEISERYYGETRIISDDYRSRVTSVYVSKLDECWWFVPTNGSDYPNEIARYNEVSKSWFIRNPAHELVSGLEYLSDLVSRSSGVAISWDGITWIDVNWYDGDSIISTLSMLLCGRDPDTTYKYDIDDQTDNGETIDYYIVTPDLLLSDKKTRFDSIVLFCKGTSIAVYYSTDQGSTWTKIGEISPGSSYDRKKLFKQIVADRVRYKIAGNTPGFGLEWMSVKFIEESEW